MELPKTNEVDIGTRVKVRGFVPGTDTVFHFVTDNEVNYHQHKVPMKGPLGTALRGAKVGDRVRVDLGGDIIQLEVLELGRNPASADLA